MGAKKRRIVKLFSLFLCSSPEGVNHNLLVEPKLPHDYIAMSLVDGQFDDRALTPPRGWNSYDSFSWVVDEQAFLDNAKIMADRLGQFGYEYAVVDFLWFRKNVEGAPFDSSGNDNVDEWGRPYPDPERWPSSADGKGFTEVANKVHAMGLKFGIHLMRGITSQAVNANTPILDVNTGVAYEESGRKWTAKDIGMTDRTCAWMPNGFMSVNTETGAGRAFLISLYRLYAKWGVDFVKLDCVFGEDLDSKEITLVSQLLTILERPVLLSISPGAKATPSLADGISSQVNMYRITGDDWDHWEAIEAHFDVARDFAAAKKIGAQGLHGKSWPDMDMLPFGWLTDPNANRGPYRKCKLTPAEQKTQMTLWSMFKSPLMYGGDLRNLDSDTFVIITNPTLLEIDSHSENNTEFSPVANGRAWIATGRQGEIYLSFFNLNTDMSTISASISDVTKVLPNRRGPCKTVEMWSGRDLGSLNDTLSFEVEGHGTAVFVLNCV